MRTEVNVKVSDPKFVCTTLRSQNESHTKFGILTANNIRDMIILETRSLIKATVTQKWYVTYHHPKMHPYTKFGIPASNNIGDMLLA